jgi:hypothetical protein
MHSRPRPRPRSCYLELERERLCCLSAASLISAGIARSNKPPVVVVVVRGVASKMPVVGVPIRIAACLGLWGAGVPGAKRPWHMHNGNRHRPL